MLLSTHHSDNQSSSETPTSSPPASSEAAADLHVLEPSSLAFRGEANRLQMRQAGEEEWQEVTLVRLFALSEPERWISVLDKDDKEIGILLDLHELSRGDLALVREELDRRYLVPEIGTILSCRQRFDMVQWTADTDRGRVSFLTRNLREQVQRPLGRHLILTDVEGNRYDIPDFEALDPASRRLLEQHV